MQKTTVSGVMAGAFTGLWLELVLLAFVLSHSLPAPSVWLVPLVMLVPMIIGGVIKTNDYWVLKFATVFAVGAAVAGLAIFIRLVLDNLAMVTARNMDMLATGVLVVLFASWLLLPMSLPWLKPERS